MSKSNYHNGRKRDVCYFCNARGTEEHHIIPQRFDGPDESTNIVGVCKPCHKKLERLYDRSFYEWFGIDDEKGERLFHRTCLRGDCDERATHELQNPCVGRRVFCQEHASVMLERDNEQLTEVSDDV